MPEYWLIDPQLEWVEFYYLEEERYRLAFSGKEGEYHALTLPDFWLRVEWLWQEPLPDTETTTWEILGHESVLRRLAQAVGIEELHRLLREWDE